MYLFPFQHHYLLHYRTLQVLHFERSIEQLSYCSNSNWRECRCPSIPNVLFISSMKSDIKTLNLHAITSLNKSIINNMVRIYTQHSSTEPMVIFDRPFKRYMSLVRLFKCCFVYESNWYKDAYVDEELGWILCPRKFSTKK